MSITFDQILEFIRSYYDKADGFISLHEPKFNGNERKYVLETIDSTYVSSVGKYVDRFEQMMSDYTGASHVVATVNGTAALHMSLIVAGVKKDDLVICQPLTFIATCNALSYLGAEPLFIDVDKDTLGLSPSKLEQFLKTSSVLKNGECIHKETGKRISACVPMHTFGHPARLDDLLAVCRSYAIPLVEDAAESIGSKYKNNHTGTIGLIGAFSFNGNKTITCGGGGAIVTNDQKIAKLAKHLTTQAKVPHPWNFVHDQIGYNYRLPNLNAALACAQMEQLDKFISSKRQLAKSYKAFFSGSEIEFIDEPPGTSSNFWLNAVLFKDSVQREEFIKFSNQKNVMTRPVWTLMNKLKMFSHCISANLDNAIEIESRLVNLPSSPKI
jgi:aminotransferase in exopolysaccharide biosynthesis